MAESLRLALSSSLSRIFLHVGDPACECEGEDGGVCDREQREGGYPFNPVKAMPRTKFFWNIRKTISGGIETRTEPAMTAW